MIKKGIIANQINEIIPPRDYKIFGVRGRNLTFSENTTDTLTRLEDSVGKEGGLDFDNEPIYKDIKQVTIKNFIEITDGYRNDRNTFSSTTEMMNVFTVNRTDTFQFCDKSRNVVSSPYGLYQYLKFAQVRPSGYGYDTTSDITYGGYQVDNTILSKELIDKGFYHGSTGDYNDKYMYDGYYFVANASGVVVGSYLQVLWLYEKSGSTFTLIEERPTNNPFYQFLWSKVPYNPTQTPILNKVYKCSDDYYRYNGGETLTIADFDLVTVPDIDVIKIPKFYIKRTTDTNNVETELISDRQVDETWKVHPAFYKSGLEKEAFYISPTIFTDQAYKIPDSNYGDFTAMTFNQVEALFTLARVEYARFAECNYLTGNEDKTTNFLIPLMKSGYRGIQLVNTSIKDFYMYSKQIGGDFNEIQNPFGSDTISINGVEYDANSFSDYSENDKNLTKFLLLQQQFVFKDDEKISSFIDFVNGITNSFYSDGMYFSYKGGINNNSFFPNSMLLSVTLPEENVNEIKQGFNLLSFFMYLNSQTAIEMNATLDENMQLSYTFQKISNATSKLGRVILRSVVYNSSSIRLEAAGMEGYGVTIRNEPFQYLIQYNEGTKLIPYKTTYTTPTRKRPLTYMQNYVSKNPDSNNNGQFFGRYTPKNFTGNSAYWDTLAKGLSFVEMEIGEEEVETLLTFTP